MKLARWSLHFYRLRYAREVVWANAREDAGVFALLKIEANGATGIAEGTLKDTWSGVSPASLKAALEDFLVPRLRELNLGDEAPDTADLSRLVDWERLRQLAYNI